MAQLWQFKQCHPKPAFSEKVQMEDHRKFFKNRPKSSPRLEGLEALERGDQRKFFKNRLKRIPRLKGPKAL